MALPKRRNLYLPLLKVLEEAGGQLPTQEAIARVERWFPALADEDKMRRYEQSAERVWPNLVRWARDDLVKRGYLDNSQPGIWRVTPSGREYLLQNWPTWQPAYSSPERDQQLGLPRRPAERRQTREDDSTTTGASDQGRAEARSSSRLHEQLKQMVHEIGTTMGYHCQMEFREALYVYDVVWKDLPTATRASRVFEVQDKGNLSDALLKLQHARDIWGSQLFLIVTGERDRRRIEQLLGPLLSGTFHRLARALTILQPADVEELHGTLTKHRDVIRKLLPD